MLVGTEPLIDQDQDASGAGHRVVERRVIRAVVGDHRDAVAAPGPRRDPAGDRRDRPVELRERRDGAVLGDESRPIRHCGSGVGHQVMEQFAMPHNASRVST